MKYFEELDSWLSAVLIAEEDENEEQWFARVKKQLKEKILESYRNGQKAGLDPKKPYTEKGESPAPRGKSFRPWPPRGGRRSQ